VVAKRMCGTYATMLECITQENCPGHMLYSFQIVIDRCYESFFDMQTFNLEVSYFKFGKLYVSTCA